MPEYNFKIVFVANVKTQNSYWKRNVDAWATTSTRSDEMQHIKNLFTEKFYTSNKQCISLYFIDLNLKHGHQNNSIKSSTLKRSIQSGLTSLHVRIDWNKPVKGHAGSQKSPRQAASHSTFCAWKWTQNANAEADQTVPANPRIGRLLRIPCKVWFATARRWQFHVHLRELSFEQVKSLWSSESSSTLNV